MQPSNDIIDGGWHFSFMGGTESVKEKLLAGCIDRNYDEIPTLVENLENSLKNLSAVTFDEDQLTKIKINDTYPEYILQNLNKFKHLIL
jgi:beta-1,4-mannosyl-glycoprotein beta-1,4-N-acetylglucosaminyltransferase